MVIAAVSKTVDLKWLYRFDSYIFLNQRRIKWNISLNVNVAGENFLRVKDIRFAKVVLKEQLVI